MKIFITSLLCLFLTTSVIAQNATLQNYNKAQDQLKAGNISEARNILKDLLPTVDKTDTLYNYVAWYYISILSQLENQHRMKEQFRESLALGQEALQLIEANKPYFDKDFAAREAWMIKNVLVSWFGLNQLDSAAKYRDLLYQKNKTRDLPKGITDYFNYDFFKLGDKNVWGYEWFAELPKDRFSSSFTKIVYYIYSTNPDGSDKEQLCRFHVLMFHQLPENAKFDYILERQQEVNGSTVSGSYYKYVYNKNVDYLKLRADIMEIVAKDIQPDSRRTISRQ